jgi:MFS family permease
VVWGYFLEYAYWRQRSSGAVMGIVAQIFSGVGLGALVGLLVALSTAHVVGSVIAALTALLAGFFGLSKIELDQGWRIGSFGFACIAGVIVGLMIRNGGDLLPSVASQMEEWKSAGYSEQQARELVALQRLGVKPGGVELVQQPTVNALFNTEDKVLCGRLENVPDVQSRLRILRQQGGTLAALAAQAEASSDPAAALAAGVKLLCG